MKANLLWSSSRIAFGVTLVLATATVSPILWNLLQRHKENLRRKLLKNKDYLSLIGNTPLIYIRCLSEETGSIILAKCEFLNPGGSNKDRVAKQIVLEAEASGELVPGGTIFEGTSGSTGISLAQLARSRNYSCVIVMPDDQAQEKYDILRALGAELILVKPSAIINEENYVRKAEKLAHKTSGGFFANQFENLANFRAHYMNTGPEIWRDAQGRVDAFVMSAGTGGTIAGVGAYLKMINPSIKVVLADPQGSSLYHKITHGVLYTKEQQEQTMKRHRYDTIIEGIGIDRLTRNMEIGLQFIDTAVRVTDKQAVDMAWRILKQEGYFIGSSSAINLCCAKHVAENLGPGHTVVTVLCGSGQRELTKLYNKRFLNEVGLM